jgi:Short C-terminal domain
MSYLDLQWQICRLQFEDVETGEPMRRRPVARMAVRTTVVAGTAAAVGTRAGARQAANAQASAPEAAPTEPAPVAAPAEAPDRIAQLTQLAALKDSGALSEAEFEAEKAKLLG